jgi:hypothetical protein
VRYEVWDDYGIVRRDDGTVLQNLSAEEAKEYVRTHLDNPGVYFLDNNGDEWEYDQVGDKWVAV